MVLACCHRGCDTRTWSRQSMQQWLCTFSTWWLLIQELNNDTANDDPKQVCFATCFADDSSEVGPVR